MPRMILIAATSYLLGSIPFGYLLVRIFRGEDVRQSGSGNIGATNVSRKSPWLGALTLLLDAAKGTGAAILATRVAGSGGASANLPMAMAALFAVLGHCFPVWLKFRGGKGVATGLGSFLPLTPKAVLLAAGVFILMILLFRYVSLGSIAAVGLFPLFALGRIHGDRRSMVFVAATSLLIIARHHQNIRRLYAGSENRVGARRT